MSDQDSAPPEPSNPSTRQEPAASPGQDGLGALALGLFLFGATLGITTGLSETSGISQVLVSSLFTFVGGVLLTYAGFRRRAVEGEASLDPRRVGHGLSALSLGILLGLYGGIYLRVSNGAIVLPANEAAELASAKPASSFSLHGDVTGDCERIHARLIQGQYPASAECEPVLSDLRDLYRSACSPAGTSGP